MGLTHGFVCTAARQQYRDRQLWHQMTFQYLDDIQRRHAKEMQQHLPQASQKLDNNVIALKKQDLVDHVQYPLYGHDLAISFWNATEANSRRPFKQHHPLTKINEECYDEQFR